MRRCWISIVKFVCCEAAAIGLTALSLSSCFVPEAAPILGHDAKKRIFYDVVRGVQCEIRHAVLKELQDDKSSLWGRRKLAWLEGWAATMDLNLKIENMVAFNPGFRLKAPNWLDAHVSRADGSTVTAGQSYSIGIGGGVSYDTTRYDKVQFAYEFRTFTKNGKEDFEDQCYKIAGITVEGDLKLYDWLDDVLEPVRKCAFFGDPFNPFEDQPEQQIDTDRTPGQAARGLAPMRRAGLDEGLQRQEQSDQRFPSRHNLHADLRRQCHPDVEPRALFRQQVARCSMRTERILANFSSVSAPAIRNR